MPKELTMHISGAVGPFDVLDAKVTEGLSAPTKAWLRLEVKEDQTGPGSDALGGEVLVVLASGGETVRAWHLVVRAVIERGHVKRHRVFELDLDDRFGLLDLRTDVRIFQEMTSKEIAAKVFDGAGVDQSSISWKLERTLVKRTYCVQHRESDSSFVERILRHDGVFRIPADEADGPKAIFADSTHAFAPIDGESRVPLIDKGGYGHGVEALEVEYKVVPDQIVLRDYNYETPALDLTSKATIGAGVVFSQYEFPGGYQTQSEGAALAGIRAEELAARSAVATGKAYPFTFRPGRSFELDVPRAPLAVEWLLREVTHVYSLRAKAAYHNEFVASPLKQAYRPQRAEQRAVVPGSHSIKVTGPSGEIHTDSLGRMKGKFFWDRVGKEDDKASCWIRVLQLPIGGSQALARMGWEMVVRYAWGDPDRPIAIARVDNGLHTAPYKYPKAASAMAFKTLSSPASGKFNEFTMEDGGGSMKFGVTASKDYNEQVNHDETEKISVDEKLEIGTDLTTNVGANQTITIGAMNSVTISANEGITIVGDRTKTVGAAETVTVTGSLTEKITGKDSETVGASHTTIAAMGVSRTSKGSHTLTIGGSMIQASAMGVSFAVAGSKSETIGGAKIIASGGAITETMIGAMAITVGGAILSTAGGNRMATAKGSSTLTVGGVAMINAGGKVMMKAPKIKLTVAGVANFLGGGGILNVTPASVSFVGLITVKGSSAVKVGGAPNLVG